MSTDKEGDPDGSKKPETIASDTENSQKNAPPLVATKTGDPPLEDDISNHHKSVHSDVTGATKHSSPFTPQQAGYCEPSFESLLCKILQRILDFRSKESTVIATKHVFSSPPLHKYNKIDMTISSEKFP